MIFQLEIFIGIILLLPLVFLIITLGLLGLFLHKYFKTKQKMFGFLMLLFLTYLLYNLFQAGQAINYSKEQAEFNFILANIFSMLILYSLVLVFEMFEKNIEFSRRQTIMTILIFAAIGGMITNPQLETKIIGDYYIVSFQESSPIPYIQALFYLITGIWLITMLYHSRKAAWSPEQKKLISWLSIGVFIAILLPTMPYLFEILVELTPLELLISNNLIKNSIQNGGMLIIGFAFLRASNKPWLLQRQRIQLLSIYSMTGVQLYSKIFTKYITENDLSLLSGGFSAVSYLFQEITKTTGGVKAILLEGKELRVINRETFICVILVKYSTDASELAHEKFTDEFEENFSNILIDFDGNTKPFEKAEDLAKHFFS